MIRNEHEYTQNCVHMNTEVLAETHASKATAA